MSDVQSSLNQMAKGAWILLIGSVLAKVINYLYRGYTARVLSVSDFGLLNLAIMIITFVVAISSIGMEAGLNRYVPYYRGLNDKKKISGVIYFSTKVTLITSIIAALGIYLFSEQIAYLFEDSASLANLLRILSISIPFLVVGMRILVNCLLYLKYVKEYSLIFNILQHISRLILTVFLISLGFGLFGAGIAYSLSAVAIGLIAFNMFNYKIKIKKEEFFEKKDFLKYSVPLFLVTIVGYLNGWIDTFMVGYLLDNYNVGIYNAAFLISQLLLLLPGIIMPLTLPIVGPHFARNEIDSVNTIAKKISKWIIAINFFILLVLLAFPGTIIRIIFGAKYYSAIPALFILLIGFFISTLAPLFLVFLSLYKKTGFILFNSVIALTANIILNIILIPKYGIIGTAIATAISNIFLVLLLIFENYRLYKVNLYSFDIIKIFIAMIVPVFIIFSSKTILNHNIIALSSIVIISFIFYLILLLKLKVIDNSDKEIIKAFEKKLGIKIPGVIFRLIRW